MGNGTLETTPVRTLREMLADYAHITWCGWMCYMFSLSTMNKDGSMTIPAKLVTRWTRQMTTSYYNLPEDEKESDLVESETIIKIVKSRPWSGL